MKKKKELWIVNHYATPPGYGGLTRHYYLAKYIQKLGYNVKIFASSAIHNSSFNFIDNKDKSLYKETVIDGVTYVHVKTSQYKGNKFGRVKNILEYYFRTPKVLKKYKKLYGCPDYIYSSTPHPLSPLIANKFAKKNNIKSVVETRDLWPETMISFGMFNKNNPIALALLFIQKKIYLGANKLVFTIEGAKDYLKTRKYYNKLPEVYWLNNGIDKSNFKKIISYKDPDLEDKNSFKVVYTGSIRYAYHLETILDVAKTINNDNIKFIIYGKGPYLESLKEKANHEKINNVSFKGFVDEKYLPYILSKCNICLLHGTNHSVFKYGTSQNKMFTYLGGNKPIISTFVNDYDLITRYKCGKSINADNINEYAKVINDFYNMDKKEYKKYCDNCKLVIDEFNYETLAKKLKNILEDE